MALSERAGVNMGGAVGSLIAGVLESRRQSEVLAAARRAEDEARRQEGVKAAFDREYALFLDNLPEDTDPRKFEAGMLGLANRTGVSVGPVLQKRIDDFRADWKWRKEQEAKGAKETRTPEQSAALGDIAAHGFTSEQERMVETPSAPTVGAGAGEYTPLGGIRAEQSAYDRLQRGADVVRRMAGVAEIPAKDVLTYGTGLQGQAEKDRASALKVEMERAKEQTEVAEAARKRAAMGRAAAAIQAGNREEALMALADAGVDLAQFLPKPEKEQGPLTMIAKLRADLDAGRITPEEFAAAVSAENAPKGTTINLGEGFDKEAYKRGAQSLFEEFDKVRPVALAAKGKFDATSRVRKLLSDPKTRTGWSAEWKNTAAKFFQAIGVPVDVGRITNTDILVSELASGVLSSPERESMRGAGALTEKDMALLSKAAAGDTSVDKAAIAEILTRVENYYSEKVDQHNALVDEIQKYRHDVQKIVINRTGASVDSYTPPSKPNFRK